ncbi:hypothetical protein [Massilia genomosp. 1]|uniref:Uncharacterized protein n=1 Tax=Massilia genomosp. 1 TaxID=2609280 RepID=A0ABX0MQG4_9BURK|nr:hypothetical protein [Massilia genomosp. 1]NHZ62208.1 hypothetical protein [Massilia genomosp. 1]
MIIPVFGLSLNLSRWLVLACMVPLVGAVALANVVERQLLASVLVLAVPPAWLAEVLPRVPMLW